MATNTPCRDAFTDVQVAYFKVHILKDSLCDVLYRVRKNEAADCMDGIEM